ncbi:MAG: RNA polymerase sigma factor [Candidatus Acidiferrales bacterium]
MSVRVDTLASGALFERHDDSNFAARLAESQRRVFQIAYNVLGNAADAEEVAQEAFLRAHGRRASLREPGRFRAWVSRIAFRLALNRQRSRRRQLARETAWHAARPETLDGDRAAADRLTLERLREEIARLPEKLRAVLLLSGVEGMDARETAAVLEIPVGTVRSRLHAARKRLLEVMTR